MVYDIDMLRKSYMRIYTMKARLAFSKEVRIM